MKKSGSLSLFVKKMLEQKCLRDTNMKYDDNGDMFVQNFCAHVAMCTMYTYDFHFDWKRG